MTINWNDGTYTFNHGNKIITKSTLQNKKACDNITNEITEIYPIDTLPNSKEGTEYYGQNWRRKSSVEKTIKPREYK